MRGLYRIIATSFDGRVGDFSLTITPQEGPKPEKFVAGKVRKIETGAVLIEAELFAGDARDRVRTNSACHIHEFELSPAKSYTIDLVSSRFDAWLRLEDAAGNQIDEDGDLTRAAARIRPSPLPAARTGNVPHHRDHVRTGHVRGLQPHDPRRVNVAASFQLADFGVPISFIFASIANRQVGKLAATLRIEPVQPPGILGPQLSLIRRRPTHARRSAEAPPRPIRRYRAAGQAHRPVAAEDDTVRTERVEAMIDDRRQIVGRESRREAVDEARDLAGDVGSAGASPVDAGAPPRRRSGRAGFSAPRRNARGSALPQWSRMNFVSGASSASRIASPRSAGRMHRSKLSPFSPRSRTPRTKAAPRQKPAGVASTCSTCRTPLTNGLWAATRRT